MRLPFFRHLILLAILFNSSFASSAVDDNDIILRPYVSYCYGTQGTVGCRSSADALLIAVNENSERLFQECLAREPGCAITRFSGYRMTEGNENKDPYDVSVDYTLIGTYTRTYNGDVKETESREIKGFMYSHPQCPKGTNGLRIDNSKYMCIDSVPNIPSASCPANPDSDPAFEFGNPIDVSTLEKREREIDFSTADGLLKLERIYVNQYQGWEFSGARKLINYEHNGTRNAACHWASHGSSQYLGHCFKYMGYKSSTRQVSVELKSGRGSRLFFRKVGDEYHPTNNSAGFLVPTNVNGNAWVYTAPDNSREFYSNFGQLTEKHMASGRKIFYVYDSKGLVEIRDDVGRSISFEYDNSEPRKNIIRATLPDGRVINYAYDNFNNLVRVKWPDGNSKYYVYNETENVAETGLENPFHFLTGKINEKFVRNGNYFYGSGGNAKSTEKANGVEKYEMYSSTTITDPLGARLAFTFKTLDDGTRVLRKKSQPAGSGCNASAIYIAYNEHDLVSQRKEFNGNVTQYSYNANKLENVRVEGVFTTSSTLSDTATLPYLGPNAVLPAGIRKISTEWHPDWRVKTRIAEAKKITTNIYNGQPDPFNSNQILNCAPASVTAPLLCKKVVQATTDANGAAGFAAVLDTSLAARVWQYTYNELGKTLTVSTPQSILNDRVETTYEYYSYNSADWRKGDLKQIRNALGHTTQFLRYDANGRVLEMIDANGVVSQFTYDWRGRLLTATQGNATTQYTYDPVGNLIRVVQPAGATLEYDYDNASRLIRIRDLVGNKIEYTLDKASNITAIKYSDNAENLRYQQTRVYDALSRVQNIINASNNSSTLKYDASGNLTSEVDANNKTTSQTYDALDQFKQRTDALNGKINYTFDAQGNLASVKDQRNNTTGYLYNPFGELIEQNSPDTGKTTFNYNAAGNRISSIDSRGVIVNYSYDLLGRLTHIAYPNPSENVQFVYDNNINNKGIGRLTSVIQNGTSMSYVYDETGLISKKIVTLNGITNNTEYQYDLSGNLTRIQYPSGLVVDYQYNMQGQVDSISTQVGGNSQTLLTNIQYLPFGPAQSYVYGNGLTHNQIYDQNYRLTAIQVGNIFDRTYTYDPVSNINNIANNLDFTKSQTFTYDALNRLTSALGGYGNLIYTYDAVGNRLTESRNSVIDNYSYATTSNRLNSITRSAGNRSFNYDNVGNPTQHTGDDNKTLNSTYNNANRLSSVNVDGSLAATYTYNPLGQRVMKTLVNGTKEIYHYDEAGQLIAVTDGAGATIREYIYWGNQLISFVANGNIYYVHTDHLNTPQVVTNQTQQVVWMGDYEPFGKLAANQSNSIEIFSRFPGQYLDAETGNYYNYFRDYDPSIGRYIESDPIGLSGGINTYAYVSGNPLKGIDPFGLAVWWDQNNGWTDLPNGPGWVPYKPGYGPIPSQEKPSDDCVDNNSQPEPYTPPVFPPFIPDVYTPEEQAADQARWDQYWANVAEERRQNRLACLTKVGLGMAATKAGEVAAEKGLHHLGAKGAAHFVPIAGQAYGVYEIGLAVGCVVRY